MKTTSEFIRFIIIGGTATALHYLILIALVQTGTADTVVASSIGFSISAVLNYLLNRSLTFRSSARHIDAFPKFLLVAITGLLINGSIIWLLLTTELVHYLLAQIVATLTTLIWNFLLNKLCTFRVIDDFNVADEGCRK